MSNRRVEGVAIRDASKQYETFCTLYGVSLDVAHAEFVSILNRGKPVQLDMPDRLHQHSRDTCIASLIGHATLVPAKRRRTNTVQRGGTMPLCLHSQDPIVVPRARS